MMRTVWKLLGNYGASGLFVVSFFYTLTTCAVFGSLGMVKEMGVALLAGGLCMAFAKMDKIARFKAAGMMAEMRDVTGKAYATIEGVQNLAAKSTSVVLELLAVSQRMCGIVAFRRMEIKEGFCSLLEELGLSKEKVAESSDRFNRWIAFDHVHRIIEAARKDVKDTDKSNQFVRDTRKISDWKTLKVASPDEVLDFLNAYGLSNAEVDHYLEDYRYFITHRQYRRPEMWE